MRYLHYIQLYNIIRFSHLNFDEIVKFNSINNKKKEQKY
jgi:hypothetical protein